MKVRASRTGFFGGRRRPGTVFDVPEERAVTPQPGMTAPDGAGEN